MRINPRAAIFLVLIFVCFQAFPQKYRIEKVNYSLEKTRELDLRRVVPVNTDKIFESKDELDSYLLDLKQRLMNTRAFDNVEVRSEDSVVAAGDDSGTVFAETHASEPKKPFSQVLPDSPSLTTPATPPSSKVKVKDVNFLGTMNTMDIGAFAGIKEDIKTGDQNLTLGGEFKYSYPFYIANFLASWNNNFDLQYTRGVNELEFYSGTGFTFERPFKRLSLIFDVSEQANRDLEYEDFGDTQFFTSDMKVSLPVKIFDIENWGFVFWTPFIDGKVSYDKDGISIKNDDLASPVISGGQTVSTTRINWYGNFRSGFSATIGHTIGYDFMQKEIEPTIFGHIQAFKDFGFAGINTRFSAFVTKSNRDKIGKLIRGARDKQSYLNTAEIELKTKKSLKTPSAMVLNVDIPIHVITTHWLDWSDFIFGEDSWFSRTFAWTDKFNFELQVSPFVDIALTKNEVTGRLFSPKDGWYTGGIEFLVFPERWKGIVMRASLGIDLGRAVIAKKYPEKIDLSWRENIKKYEIYAGIGLHY